MLVQRRGIEGARGAIPVQGKTPGTLQLTRDERFEAEALPQLRALFGAAYRMTGNVHDAEDLVQETFLRAYRAFDRYRPGTNARAWLITILQRVRTDAFRRRQRRPPTVELIGDGPATPPPQDALASGGEILERALAALPEPFRTAVVLRDVQELSYAEIADALAIPVGTVMSRIHRGRALLRAALEGTRP
jgi:RNA polymerase sigma-70 factor (ECF subfamily)